MSCRPVLISVPPATGPKSHETAPEVLLIVPVVGVAALPRPLQRASAAAAPTKKNTAETRTAFRWDMGLPPAAQRAGRIWDGVRSRARLERQGARRGTQRESAGTGL